MRKSANAACSTREVPWSARYFSWRTGSTSVVGTTSHPSRSAGRERLRRRAGVDHPFGLEPLEGADGRAVVAVLGVVVVLDRDRVAVAQPGEQRRAALGAEHDAGRVLVRGGDDHRVDVAELVDLEAVLVDSDRDGLQAGALRDLVLLRVARVLDRDPLRAVVGQRAADRALSLPEAVGDDDAAGVGDDAAHAAEVVGQRGAQRLVAARVAVAEVGVGEGVQRGAQRAQPGRAREGGDVGDAGAEVVARRDHRAVAGVGAGGWAMVVFETRGRAPCRRLR